MSQQILDRITATGNKRILCLDGGGIRGAVSLGYLQKLEGILSERYKIPNFKLCQYFDLIAGTSTGSIIATALAMGMRVDEIMRKYVQLGKEVFYDPQPLLFNKTKYDGSDLEAQLEKLFKQEKLDSNSLLN